MSNIFKSIRVRRPKRHKFNLSHEVKLTCNIGDLIPVDWREVVPGDSFQHKVEALVRFQALLAPLMHRVDVYFHHFFVPNRLIWDDFENFITGGEDGQFVTTPPLIKFITGSGTNSEAHYKQIQAANTLGTLADFLGVPSFVDLPFDERDTYAYSMDVSALPFRAYQLIYNEWYRDQNLQEEIDIDKSSTSIQSVNAVSGTYYLNPLVQLRKRNWHKDYFTSALPWTQRGGDVTLPLNGSANVNYVQTPGLTTVMRNSNTGEILNVPGSPQNITYGQGSKLYTGTTISDVDNSANLEVDLSSASGSTVNELRRSIAIQQWLEKNARGGARYIEQILSHFGVMGKDSRLQRPQYLGGSKSPVSISEVVQNSATGTGDTPQGNLAGKALAVTYDNGYKRFFDEHGIVMTIMSIVPKANYQQGLARKFQRRDKFDYYFPEFAHLGEQPIFKSELFYDFTKPTSQQQDAQSFDLAQPFGYTPRYAEYKTELNRVHGQFKDTLSFWHMGRIFANSPGLNGDFVKIDAQRDDLNRVFATENVTDANGNEIDKIEVQLYHDIKAKRPMPVYGTPMI